MSIGRGQQIPVEHEFDGRARDYDEFRPTYPPAVITLLKEFGLTKQAIVADVGAGTGIMSRVVAPHVARVFAVEPNDEMRTAAERMCKSITNITVLSGSAEDTGLLPGSVDFIIAAQAFHFFQKDRTKLEFTRIGTRGAQVVLVWNVFSERCQHFPDYQRLLTKYATNPAQTTIPDFKKQQRLSEFFPAGFDEIVISHQERLAWEHFVGHVFSYSYLPQRGQEQADELERELVSHFDKWSVDGLIEMNYEAMCYFGKA